MQTSAAVDLEDLAKRPDPIAELLRFIRGIPTDDTMCNDLLSQFKELKQKLPLELRQGADAINLDDPSLIRDALGDVEQTLIARLLEQEVPR